MAPIVCDTFQIPKKFWYLENGIRQRHIIQLLELWEDRDDASDMHEQLHMYLRIALECREFDVKKFYILIMYSLLQGKAGQELLQDSSRFRNCVISKYEEFMLSTDQTFTDALRARKPYI